MSRLQPNSEFENVVMHPRFGYIMSLVACRDIAAGEEVTVNYNYKGDHPRWFSEARKGIIRYLSQSGPFRII